MNIYSSNPAARQFVCLLILITVPILNAASENKVDSLPDPVLKHSDVVFMYAASDDAYKAYNATFVAWGGADTAEQVARHHRLSIKCTGSMWCLTAGAKNIHEDEKLRNACAVDIEGKPVLVPWQFDHTYQGTKTYFGCTNHPDFRALCEKRVKQCMAGRADGLHVDDHLGAAHPALWQGGGLCDYCIAAFRQYLTKHAGKKQLDKAQITDLQTFDYRDLIRKYAATRDEYKKVQHDIPLMDMFLRFHTEAAAQHIEHLGSVARQVTGRPITLSVNAGLPNRAHTHVAKYLTHIVGEVDQRAASGTDDIAHPIEAYEMAAKLNKPLAATASGWDWAFVKANHCENLVKFWIALAYAHGQRFMVPHPTQQWCFTNELGTHWYQAPIEEFAHAYRFIRDNARYFDGFVHFHIESITTPQNVHFTLRTNPQNGITVIHLLNKNYDKEKKLFSPLHSVEITLPALLLRTSPENITAISPFDTKQTLTLKKQNDNVTITIPKLSLWTILIFEKS
jgi:hypothetical protein